MNEGGNIKAPTAVDASADNKGAAMLRICVDARGCFIEMQVTVTDPTADRTITLPDAIGTVILESCRGYHSSAWRRTRPERQ